MQGYWIACYSQPVTVKDTNRTCIQNWKIKAAAEEIVRGQSLRKDTAALNKIISLQWRLVDDKNTYILKDSLLMAIKDSTSNFWQKAYTLETKSHSKTKDKLENRTVLSYILGATTLILLIVVAFGG